MANEDKYATADSAMCVKVTASDKVVPTPATPKPAGENQGGQNNNKRKADQMDSRSNSKLVASVEAETSAPQAGLPRKRPNRNNTNWLPKQSFEQLLDAPCKIHSRAQPSTHTLRQCSFARRLSQGDGLPAPPVPVVARKIWHRPQILSLSSTLPRPSCSPPSTISPPSTTSLLPGTSSPPEISVPDRDLRAPSTAFVAVDHFRPNPLG
ncbi:hypothetical protein D1007_29462 [Hordeum vulgare]|nr:hypothetical protein D1007_29462 [Hordeum vulgare]